jgi:hypothetical protein
VADAAQSTTSVASGVMSDLLDTVQERLRDQAERRPYRTVLLGLAAGYVLGGGIPWWAVRSATAIVGRELASRAVAGIVKLDS